MCALKHHFLQIQIGDKVGLYSDVMCQQDLFIDIDRVDQGLEVVLGSPRLDVVEDHKRFDIPTSRLYVASFRLLTQKPYHLGSTQALRRI